MIKKGLALQSSSLREDELELEVPPDLVAGRLGGAHSLQRISGRALASRLEWISVGESLCWFWGRAAPSRPDFSLCLAASLDVLGGAPGLPRPRMCSLPLPDVPPDLGCCAERQFRNRAFSELWTYVRKAGDRSSMVGWLFRKRAHRLSESKKVQLTASEYPL